MKAILASLPLYTTLVWSSPTKTLRAPPTVARAVGDTTQVSVSGNNTWTMTITIQSGSDGDYDGDELGDLQTAFTSKIGGTASNATSVTATYTDANNSGHEIDLSSGSGVTKGDHENGDWTGASAYFLDWTTYQAYPTKFTAKVTDDGDDGNEIGFFEYTFTRKSSHTRRDR